MDWLDLFRYDLNQIPHDSTVEVTNRFKGLDMINRVPEKLWMETVWEVVIKTIPKKKKRKKAKWLSELLPVVIYGCESWTIRKPSAEELMLLNCGVGEDS